VLTVSDSEHEGLMGVPDVAERVAERGRVAFRQRSEALRGQRAVEVTM
jgi:hypothetical protein